VDDDDRRWLFAEAPPFTARPQPTPVAPRELATAWTLEKRKHRASCRLVEHPLGVEVLLAVDGDLLRSQVMRVKDAAVSLAADWRANRWSVPAEHSRSA
jgi:hypothetical protein